MVQLLPYQNQPIHTFMEIIHKTQRDEAHNRYYHALVNVLSTGNWIIDQIKTFVQPENITPQQYHILCILGRAGQPLSTFQLRENMPDKMSDTCRIVARLISKGLVQKVRSSKDKRLVEVTLTDPGLQLLDRIKIRQSELDQILHHLTEDEVDQLDSILKKLRNHQ